MTHRRNCPLPTALVLDELEVRQLRAGFSGGVADDNAEHVIHGSLTLSGAADTMVLTVEQHATVQGLLSAGRLAVGFVTDPDPTPYDDPYAAASGDSADPYPDIYGDGYSPPERTGLTVDAGGNVRMTGFEVVKDARTGVVLRAPDGNYYSFTVDAAGRLSTTGRLIGTTPP